MRQIVALGLSASAVRSRCRSGRLHASIRRRGGRAASLLTRKGRSWPRRSRAAGHRGVASGGLDAVRAALGAAAVDRRRPRRGEGRQRHGIRIHGGLTLTPATSPSSTTSRARRSRARCSISRGRDAARGRARARPRRAAADPRHARDRRRPRARQRAPRREAAARVLAEHRVGSTLTRNDLEEAFLAICRADRATRPTPSTSGSRSPTAAAPRPTSCSASSA